MELATLMSIALRTSVWLIVFGLALDASPQDELYLFRRPEQFVRSLVAMNVMVIVGRGRFRLSKRQRLVS